MACHVRVITVGQTAALVTVVSTVTVALVPLQASTTAGGSKLHDVPQFTVLFVAQVSTSGDGQPAV